MFFELVGTIVAGVAAGIFVWAINRLLKGRLPGWLAPVAAGAAMLIATISSEYGWFDRTTATMPQGFVVAESIQESTFYRPWTYAFPLTTRFVAVDKQSVRTNPAVSDQRIVDLIFYGRWARTAKIPVLLDCVGGRRADIVDGVEFAENGEVQNAVWVDLPDGDPILREGCKEV